MGSKPPFQHRPYDGTSQPFSIGLRPIEEKDWLEADNLLYEHIAEKERLIAENLNAVFRAEEKTSPSQEEVLALVLEHLQHRHSGTHTVSERYVRLNKTGVCRDCSEKPALLTAARLIQEDLVIMRSGPDGYRLAAACLCFPSSWSLAEKFGRSMWEIHETVPGFNGSRTGTVVARLFDNLKPGQLVCRYNWSVYPDAEMFNPLPRRLRSVADASSLAQLFLRVERQTLRRMTGSGDILFTIKIHHDPLAALVCHGDKSEICRQLRDQLLALDGDQLAYKGLTTWRDSLADALTAIECGQAV